MTPYLYKLRHKPSGRYYIGSQYGKNSNPEKLWSFYKTSSKYVKQLIEETGESSFEILRIRIRQDAREYEAKLLKRLYRIFGRDKFLSVMINRNVSPGILLTEEIIDKANKKRKISNSLSAKKLYEQGRHNFQISPAGNMDHVKKLRAERMLGNNLGSLKKLTDEYRNKQAEGAKGNTNVRGTRWWTNGKINRRSKEKPDEEFYLGTVKHEKHNELKLTDERVYFKPFRYEWAFTAWLRHEQAHWLFGEVPMLEDVKDWKKKLSEEEKNFLTNIFRFFTQGDIDVAGGYVKNYLPNFPQPEVRMMLAGFAAREALHIAAYSHLIETLGMPDSTYNEFLQYQAMKDKHEYFEQFANLDAKNIAQQIAAFSAFTEGLQLFSSFIMLLNFPRHGLMKGMGQIVTWSIVDETMHCEAMIKLFRTFIEENRDIWNDELKSQIYTIAEKMVELEDKFIDLAFSMGPMKDLSPEDVKQYIRYIADRRLISLGLKGIFKVKKNPLPWVEEMINAPTHTNFFENRATDYAKGALSGSWEEVWAK